MSVQTQTKVKILGDHVLSEFMKDAKVAEILGQAVDFTHASSVTTLALELDPRGPETYAILCCMNSIFDGLMIHESSTSSVFDRLRLVLDAYMTKNREVYLCLPLGWSSGRVTRQYQDMVARLHQFVVSYASKQSRLKVLKRVDVIDSWFQSDGIRLKPEFGIKYVTLVMQAVRRCFDRGGLVSLSDSLEKDMRSILNSDEEKEEDDVFMDPQVPVSGNESLVLAFEQQAQDLRQLKTEFGDLKEELRKRKLLDSYRFAEIAENEDFKLNTANSNRVMVTGLRSTKYPMDPKDQQPFVVELIGNLIKTVLGKESAYSVKIWTVEHRRLAKGTSEVMIPAVEVTFTENVKDAIEFRKTASIRAKSKEQGFEGVYFSLYVGLQTRIRCEILRSLSDQIKLQNSTMDAYCVSNGLRPLLSYGAKGTRVGRKTYLFVAALKHWESLHEQLDLTEAYKKARNTFTGKLEHLFVVMKEEKKDEPATGSNVVPVGNKRPPEEELSSASKKS